jgi:hypothetical protein
VSEKSGGSLIVNILPKGAELRNTVANREPMDKT